MEEEPGATITLQHNYSLVMTAHCIEGEARATITCLVITAHYIDGEARATIPLHYNTTIALL